MTHMDNKEQLAAQVLELVLHYWVTLGNAPVRLGWLSRSFNRQAKRLGTNVRDLVRSDPRFEFRTDLVRGYFYILPAERFRTEFATPAEREAFYLHHTLDY